MIGIFDSGSGGLSVLKELKEKAPLADFVYFGDFANLPYGNRSPEELGALTVVVIEKLISEGANEIISACNSVSASVAQPIISLLGRSPFKIIEMVGPTVDALKNIKDKKILIASTEATKNSGIYTNAFRKEGVTVDSIAIANLVKAIEDGKSSEFITGVIKEATRSLDTHEIVVLGCTQFPFAKKEFENVFGDKVEVINPAKFVAEKAIRQFDIAGSGKKKFLISKDSVFFRDQVLKMFPNSDVEVI